MRREPSQHGVEVGEPSRYTNERSPSSVQDTRRSTSQRECEHLTDEAAQILSGQPRLVTLADDMLDGYTNYLKERHVYHSSGDKEKGLSENTAYKHKRSLDRLLRWFWKNVEPRVVLLPDDADLITDAMREDKIRKMDGSPYSIGSKRKLQNALKCYNTWLEEEFDMPKWEPEHEFRSRANNSADFFTKDELARLRKDVIKNGNGPSYRHVSPAERRRFKELLAEMTQKPVEEVKPSDWSLLDDSLELPALINVGSDAGLRPTDVQHLLVDHLRLEKGAIYVPEEEGVYKRDHNRHEVAIREETAALLKWWLRERDCYDRYQDTDLVFVNERGNPLKSGPLNQRLRTAMEMANIDASDRKIVWTSLRHTIGTHMVEVADRKHAQRQLRHNSPRTTAKYIGSSTEKRQQGLNEMIQ